MKNKAQQEMVGFVLIVVLVIVGLMVFLMISLRTNDEVGDDLRVANFLDVLLRHTTECAVGYESNYYNFQELLKSCYKDERCVNLGDISTCDYLNESLANVTKAMIDSEASIGHYEIEYIEMDDPDGGFKIEGGDPPSGAVSGSQRSFGDLMIRMKVWHKDNSEEN